MTKDFIDILKKKMTKFGTIKEDLVAEFSQRDYDDLMDGWQVKVEKCSQVEQGWGLFKVVKN